MKSDIPRPLVQVRKDEMNSDGGADGGFRCWCGLKNSSQPQTIVYHYQHRAC